MRDNALKTEDMKTPTGSSYRTYIVTWLILLALTGLAVGVYLIHMGTAGVAIALSIASLKAALILVFFMHLRQESRFLQGVFLLPVVLLGVIIGFTFLDVWYR
jgi:cytochrome c oxidase subunit 4